MNALAIKFDKTIFTTLLGTLLIAIFAQISIDIDPVPITLQTVAVMLIGYRCSPMQAFKITTLYIALGTLGLPIFSGLSFGPQVLFGTTGGYLIGFIASACFISYAMEKLNGNSWLTMILLGLIATIITFIFGITWLGFLIGFEDAMTFGLFPFIIPGVAKVVMLTALLKMPRVAL